MKCGRLSARLAFAAFCASYAGFAGSFLERGDRWILSGDSITSTDIYRQILQLAAEHYHPGADIVIGNRGVWGQKLSEEKKLEEKSPPKIVSTMIAMNSFIHREAGSTQDYSRVVADHIKGLRGRIREWRGIGAEVLLMTPTVTDEREGGFFVTYNTRRGLEEVGAAIRELANEEGCFLVPVAEDVAAYAQTMGPMETFIPDGVHPYGYGQYVIANAFIRRMDFAGDLGGGRRLKPCGNVDPLPFVCRTPYLNEGDRTLVFGTDGVRGHLRWSLWCDSLRMMTADDCAAHCLGRGEAQLEGVPEWRLTLDAGLRIGERARLMVDIVPEDGVSRLYCIDLAKNRVVPFADGIADGIVTAKSTRRSGAVVSRWRMREKGKELWLEGTNLCNGVSAGADGAWGNVFRHSGLQLLFDFRPGRRFAGVNPDRDAPMVLLSVRKEPEWSVMPFVWMGRRYQACLFAHAEPCEGGYSWRIGFRGNITDCEGFDISRIDCFGLHMIVADAEGDDVKRYALQDYSPPDNPERRMNQMTVFDRKGKFTGGAVTSVNFFAFRP